MVKKDKSITIKDIARVCRLSVTTVSRALNNDAIINAKTSKKVKEAALLLEYQKNLSARNLRMQKKAMTIGLITQGLDNKRTMGIISGLEHITSEAGYTLLVANTSGCLDCNIRSIKNLCSKRIDGLFIYLSPGQNNLNHIKSFLDNHTPIVFIETEVVGEKYKSVLIDNKEGGYLATRHLIDQGCKNIVLLSAGVKDDIYRDRYEGFLDALKGRKSQIKTKCLITDNLNYENADEVARQITTMKPMPDGIFIMDDLCAVFLMRALNRKGVKVPDDVALIGFNNDEVGKVVTPMLSTIDCSGRKVGELAAKVLLSWIIGSKQEQLEYTTKVTPTLIARASSNRLVNLRN